MKHSTWWWCSAAVSLLLTCVLLYLWVQMNVYNPYDNSDRHPCGLPDRIVLPCDSAQLTDRAVTDGFLQDYWKGRATGSTDAGEPTVEIRTGIFLQSLSFSNSTEVDVSGYIWQHYPDDLPAGIKPAEGETGFILPELVNSPGGLETEEAYRLKTADGETIGWYFEATLRQPFDYDRYPFDHKTAWVRMWHQKFWRNIVLVPDLDAYDETRIADIFGIEKSIVLGTWEAENAYFDYELSGYDTDFGIRDYIDAGSATRSYIGKHGFPELRYNFVVKRKFENAFIVYLLPLLLVAMLLFAALLTVSGRDELSGRFGFNTSGFISACSALFFVVLLAHIQLREQFAGSGIVYIEYFYILMYALLVGATANVYVFSLQPQGWFRLILYEDNIVVKVAFWPLVLGSLILITLGFL